MSAKSKFLGSRAARKTNRSTQQQRKKKPEKKESTDAAARKSILKKSTRTGRKSKGDPTQPLLRGDPVKRSPRQSSSSETEHSNSLRTKRSRLTQSSVEKKRAQSLTEKREEKRSLHIKHSQSLREKREANKSSLDIKRVRSKRSGSAVETKRSQSLREKRERKPSLDVRRSQSSRRRQLQRVAGAKKESSTVKRQSQKQAREITRAQSLQTKRSPARSGLTRSSTNYTKASSPKTSPRRSVFQRGSGVRFRTTIRTKPPTVSTKPSVPKKQSRFAPKEEEEVYNKEVFSHDSDSDTNEFSDEEEVEAKNEEASKRFSCVQGTVYCRAEPDERALVTGSLEKGELVDVEETNGNWVKHSKGWTQIKKGRRVYLEEVSEIPQFKLKKSYSLGIRLLRPTKSTAEFLNHRQETKWKPLGIQNRGNTCFFNTTLQALLSSQRFVRTVLSINVETLEASKERLQEEISDKWVLKNKMMELDFIKDLVHDTKRYHQTATTRNKNRDVVDFDRVLSRFRALYPQFDNTCEHDAQESLISFLDVCGQIKTNNRSNYRISHLFRVHFQIERELTSGRKKKTKISQDNGYVLRVNTAIDVKGNTAKIESLEEALDYEIRWKNSSDTFKEDGKEYSFRERSLIVADETPEQLIIHLSRFRMKGRQAQKLKHDVQFSDKLDLAPYTTDELTFNMYRLHAVLIHAGRSANSGHYYTHVRNSENPDGVIWTCNDKNVTSKKQWKTKDAYVLFYVKVNSDEDEFFE